MKIVKVLSIGISLFLFCKCTNSSLKTEEDCTNWLHENSRKIQKTFCHNSDSSMMYWAYNKRGCEYYDYKVYFIKDKAFTEFFACNGESNGLSEGTLAGLDKFGNPKLIREGAYLGNGQLGFYKNDKKDGIWLTFGSDSNVIVKEKWEYGILISKYEYNRK